MNLLMDVDCRSRWAPKVYLEHTYHLQGFFEIMTMAPNTFPGMGVTWWPFVTHFTGCQFCIGRPNTMYDVENCHRHMDRAYKVANNQVLQANGYTYNSLQTLPSSPSTDEIVDAIDSYSLTDQEGRIRTISEPFLPTDIELDEPSIFQLDQS